MPDDVDENREGQVIELAEHRKPDGNDIEHPRILNSLRIETQNVVANTNNFSKHPNKNLIHLGREFMSPDVNNWGYIHIDTRKPPEEVDAFIKKYLEEAKWLRAARESEIKSLQEELNDITEGSKFRLTIRTNDIENIKLLPPPNELYQTLRALAHSLVEDPPVLSGASGWHVSLSTDIPPDIETRWYLGLGEKYSHRKTGNTLNVTLDSRESFLSHRRYVERLCRKPLSVDVWDYAPTEKPVPTPRSTGGLLSFSRKSEEPEK